MSNIEKRIEKNIFLTKFGTYQVRKFEQLGYKVKSFKTLEEARARRNEIEESIKDRKKGGFAYPDTLFDELFKDKSEIDIDYVYNHFDENLKYIFQNDKHCLNEREVEMFCLYYISGYTLEAIGNICGISRERVRQIISKSKRKINHSATINYLRYGYEVQQNQDDIEKIKEQIQIEKKRLIEELRQPTITEEDLINFNKNMLIDELDLSVRGYNSLVRAGIRTVGDLTNLTDNDLWAVRNLGRRTHAEIIETLKERGFSLKEEE